MGINQDPKDSKEPSIYAPGTQVLIKAWKDGSPEAQLQPTWKGSYPVILSTPSEVEVAGDNYWIHYLQVSCGKKQKRTLNTPVNKLQHAVPVQQGYIKLHLTT